MQEFSKEIIEIDGEEYTLFLNRKGIISWENITKVSKKANELQEKYKEVSNILNDDKPIELKNDDNPFDYIDILKPYVNDKVLIFTKSKTVSLLN